MKVYTVYESNYDESMIVGVFSNKAAADMFVHAVCMKYPKSKFECNYLIEEWNVVSTINTENM